MSKHDNYFRRGITILEINVENITNNYLYLSKLCNPGITGAVIKANAYGCGVETIGKSLSKSGCNFFFVAKLDEGIELRKHLDKSKNIAVFDGYLDQKNKIWEEYNLIPVCNTFEQAIQASKNKIKFMIHIDTGMNRLGLSEKDAHKFFKSKKLSFQNLILILSHFACSDNIKSRLNVTQIRKFENFNHYYPHIKRSISNSHGIFLSKEAKFDLSRPGIALYGYINNRSINLLPSVKLLSPILQVRKANLGDTVGYDATYKITKKSTLGVLGLGYADGLKRSIGSRKELKMGKFKIPILGRVSMDTIVVDFTKIPKRVLNQMNHIPIIDDNYTISDMAKDCSTIPYEVMTSFGNRIKRVYT